MTPDANSSSDPKVTVLLPAYNAQEFIEAAVESVLAQTLTEFEIVVIDDGSTDATPQLLAELASRDKRIRVITHEHNQGLVAALNGGLKIARAELVARLDADDTAYPQRLERQVQIFHGNPDVVLCATAYERVDADANVVKTAGPPLTHAALAGALLTGNCLIHSSVMFRRSSALAVGGYHAEWFPAEDYDLWIRLLDVGRYQGLSSVEVRYLQNPEGVSSSSTVFQTEIANRRAVEYVERWSGENATEMTAGDAPPSWRADRRVVRVLQHAAHGIARQLRSSGISPTGVYAPPLGVSAHLLRRYGRPARQLLLMAWAPRLMVLGQLDRRRLK